MNKQTCNMKLAIRPPDAHVTESQWVIALKEKGHLPPSSKYGKKYQVALTEEEYEEVLERASLNATDQNDE